MPVGNSLDFYERREAIRLKKVGRALGKRWNAKVNKPPTCTPTGKWMNLFVNSKLVKNFDKLLNPFVSNRAFRLSEPVDRQRVGCVDAKNNCRI